MLTTDDLDSWIELSYELRLTDGLPVLPPTREAVARLIEGSGLDPDTVVGPIPPRMGIATVETLAANAVMAGCRPEVLPIVVTAVEAMLEDRFNLRGVQCTTHSCWPLVIVSGPLVEELGMASAESVFSGGGVRANVSIGRAVRLALWNLGGTFPGEPVKEVFGHPGRFGFCIAESPDSPWPPLHEARGVDSASGLTVFACEAPHSVAMWHAADEPEHRLAQLADALRTFGNNNAHSMGETMAVITPNEARHLDTHGYDRRRVQEELFARARNRLGDLVAPGREPYGWWPEWVDGDDPEFLVPVVERPDDIHVAVAGAQSIPWMAACPGWGNLGGFAVSRPL